VVAFAGGKSHLVYIIEQVPLSKSRLILKNILQNTQMLQLFTINIRPERIYKRYSKRQAGKLE